MKTIHPSVVSSLVTLALVGAAWCNPPVPTPPPGGVYCPPGYVWNGATWLATPGEPPVFTPLPSHPPVFCPPGYAWNGVTCLLAPVPTFNPLPTPPPIVWPTPLPIRPPVCLLRWPGWFCKF